MRQWIALCLFLNLALGAPKLDEMPYNEEFDSVEVELLISYKIVSKDNIAQRERYRVSHVMNYQGESYRVVRECEIDVSPYRIMDDMPYFITLLLKREKEQVLECLYSNEVQVREATQGRNNALSSRVSLEIPPTRVRAMLMNKSIVLKILAKE